MRLPYKVVESLEKLPNGEKLLFLERVGQDIGDALGLLAIPFQERLCAPHIDHDGESLYVSVDVDGALTGIFQELRRNRLGREKPGVFFDILELECVYYG